VGEVPARELRRRLQLQVVPRHHRTRHSRRPSHPNCRHGATVRAASWHDSSTRLPFPLR
jgi:hypothetical protein